MNKRYAIALLFLFAFSNAQVAQTSRAGNTPSDGSVLMVVYKREGGTVGFDAFLELHKGILREPGSFKQSQFDKRFLRVGKHFRLLFGGGEVGSVTVTGEVPADCSEDHLPVGVVETSIRLGGQVRALATNSSSLGQRASARRAPNSNERAAALNLAQSIYRQKGVPAVMLKNMQTINLTATDLDGDGKFELIGSFTLHRTEGVSPHELFLLARPATQGFEPDLVFYYGNSSQWEQTLFVDQIDLDGDKTAELVLEKSQEPEANRIQIYKRQRGRWVRIYERPGWSC